MDSLQRPVHIEKVKTGCGVHTNVAQLYDEQARADELCCSYSETKHAASSYLNYINQKLLRIRVPEVLLQWFCFHCPN